MKNKFKNLTAEDRSIGKRLIVSASVSTALVFTFLFYGIFDLTIGNKEFLPFILGDILPYTIIISLIVLLVLTGIFMIFKGKIFDIVISLAIGILIAGYIQGNFLNLDMGQLNGDKIEWSKYYLHTIINLAIWCVIIALPLVLRYFSRKTWFKCSIFVCVLLVGMQLSSMVTSIITTNFVRPSENKYLSQEGMYEVSDDENIIVFLLDRLDGKYINIVKENNPDFFDELEGFTYFSNHTSMYCRTFPSVPYMFSKNIFFGNESGAEYLDSVWVGNKFFKEMKEKGFTTKMYLPDKFTYSDINQLADVADNISDGKISIDKLVAIKKMVRFSAYRYAPHIAKESLWFPYDTFKECTVVSADDKPFMMDDAGFVKYMAGKGISTGEPKKNFAYYHFEATHAISASGEDDNAADRENIIKCTEGSFEQIVYPYIEQMKKLGIYENSTIIITGDHGKSKDIHNLDTYKTVGLFVKPKGKSTGKVVESKAPVSHDNFMATIIKAAGGDDSYFGKSVFDVKDDEDTKRRFMYRVDRGNGKSVMEEFQIGIDATDIKNWKKVGEIEMKDAYI